MSFYERFYGFRALSIIGKCTSRHLFAYGGLCIISMSISRLDKIQFFNSIFMMLILITGVANIEMCVVKTTGVKLYTK